MERLSNSSLVQVKLLEPEEDIMKLWLLNSGVTNEEEARSSCVCLFSERKNTSK